MFINVNPFKNQSHGTLRVPWLTLGLSFLMVTLYLLADQLFNLFLFNKASIAHGQLWRLLTGHFVHCSFEHLFWDLAAFIMLGAVIEMHERSRLIPSLLVSCLGVSTWLWFDQSQWTYCGLSGALNGLLVVATVIQWKKTRSRMYLWVFLATVAKIIFEFVTHQTIFTSLSSQAVPSAHAAGLLIGTCYTLWGETKNVLFHRLLTLRKSYNLTNLQ